MIKGFSTTQVLNAFGITSSGGALTFSTAGGSLLLTASNTAGNGVINSFRAYIQREATNALPTNSPKVGYICGEVSTDSALYTGLHTYRSRAGGSINSGGYAMGTFSTLAYQTTNTWTESAYIRTISSQAHSNTALGTLISFGTTANNSTTVTERWRVNDAGHFLAGADNTYDIGASGATRPRNLYVGTSVFTGIGGVNFDANARIRSPADSQITFFNAALNDFGRLNFGGTSSSFPALKRSTTSLQARLADDTDFTSIQGKLTTETAYAAGAPTPTGYIVLYDSTGTAYKVPAEAV